MKIFVMPDIHGITTWKEQVYNVLNTSEDQIIFLGDYVDSFVAKPYIIIQNLKDIIELKKQHSDRVTLLLGNHDYAYVFGKFSITGFDMHMWFEYRHLINSNWDLFDLAWGYQGKERYTLLTHAGLTDTFYDELVAHINNPENVLHDVLVLENEKSWKDMPLHEFLNYFKDSVSLMWHISFYRRGDNYTGSILWADKRELYVDRYPGIDQIVGHTHTNEVEIRKYPNDDTLYFIDTHAERANEITGFSIEL